MTKSDGPAARGLALAVLTASQLLIVLDATIVVVALPYIRDDLGLGPAALQWVVTAYLLAFGGFLLLGGRLADRLGRRRLFVAGATAFGVGSAAAALAGTAAVLLAGRALQGLGAAALAPASLSLLMVVFAPGRGRDRALAVWGAVSAAGTVIGLIAGGILVELLSWPWVFWVTVPVAAAAAASARALLPESRDEQATPFDVAGALLGTAGLAGLVLGLVQATESGWASPAALPVLAGAAALLLGLARLEATRVHALVPIRLLRDPTVLGGNLIGLLLGAAIHALFYFLSLFMAGPLGYGPLLTGLAFLPLTVAITLGSGIAGNVIGRTGTRPLLVVSTALIALALASLIRISPHSTYLPTLLPAFLLAGLGVGLAFVGLTTAAVGSAPAADSGIAAAVFTTAQQVGGVCGLAVLTSVTAAHTRDRTPSGADATAEAVTGGWALGFGVAATAMAAALLITLTVIPAQRPPARLA